MKRKILITGISSAIMQKLCLMIDLSAYEVCGITRKPDASRLNSIKIVKGDLRNIHEFAYCFEGCYVVIHEAAVTHSLNEKDYYRINLEATESLVEIAKDRGVMRFIYISSNTAGTKSGAYGLTKLLAEEYIQEHCDDWTILRLSEFYGGDKNESIDKLISNMIDKSLVLCPVGIPFKFYPIHIDDTVRIMHSRIFYHGHANKISVVNGPDGFSFREVIALTETIAGKKVRVIHLNRKVMILIKYFTRILPISFDISPDQVDRVYSVKHLEEPKASLMKMETYIKKLIESRQNE
jgi:nucleoside-diphosphate-sugar epimerase